MIHSSSTAGNQSPIDMCASIEERLYSYDIWKHSSTRTHLISPEPFYLSTEEINQLKDLGKAILAFYQAANKLYIYKGNDWVKEYLDIGKSEDVIRHSRMNYHKQTVPRVLRPDIMLTKEGFYITELDSIPGGIGHLSCLSLEYEKAGYDLVGSPDGMLDGFARAMREASGVADPVVAIVVSDESDDYRAEMASLCGDLRKMGLRIYAIPPSKLEMAEDRLYIVEGNARIPVDLIYRFYELFDLPNIPESEMLTNAVQRRLVPVTPPYKHFLEEKMLLALLHMESLEEFWIEYMGEQEYKVMLERVVPTWILDNRPIPPHAQISGFKWEGKPVRDWRVISRGTQKQRAMVIKPSGFSPLAWGSRGVKIGSDMSGEQWADSVSQALDSFSVSPHVLQSFHEAKLVNVPYRNHNGNIDILQGRTRLCPYYFIYENKANLAGIMATICPKDKKIIHGMKDSVIVPCAEMQRFEDDSKDQ